MKKLEATKLPRSRSQAGISSERGVGTREQTLSGGLGRPPAYCSSQLDSNSAFYRSSVAAH